MDKMGDQACCHLLLPGKEGGGLGKSISESHCLAFMLSPLLSSWETSASGNLLLSLLKKG